IVSALALVMAHTLGEFGVILMIGGSIPGETRVLSIAIYDQVQAFRSYQAAIMSAVLLAFSLVAIAPVHVLARVRRGDGHAAWAQSAERHAFPGGADSARRSDRVPSWRTLGHRRPVGRGEDHGAARHRRPLRPCGRQHRMQWRDVV